MYIVIICLSVCDVTNCEISLSFRIKIFSYITKSQNKNLNILRTKEALNMKQKSRILYEPGKQNNIGTIVNIHSRCYLKTA